mgnify:CR=1 FL=1
MINVKEEVIMKKSKWLALLMAATMVMGVMTGCGGGDTNAPATGDAGTTATTEKKDEKIPRKMIHLRKMTRKTARVASR